MQKTHTNFRTARKRGISSSLVCAHRCALRFRSNGQKRLFRAIICPLCPRVARRRRRRRSRSQRASVKRKVRAMASTGAVPFWRAAGMTYISYSNICASLVRNCLKEPYRSEAVVREKVHFAIAKWANGKPEKPIIRSDSPEE